MLGTGPGDLTYLAPRALQLLRKAVCVAGYSTYIELIKPELENKEILATGMMKEIDRVESILNQALSGKTCALISGGDAGIYAMAGLVFEICEKKGIHLIRYDAKKTSENMKGSLEIEIVPGIPALAAGASLLGAPLTHDFAAISLSDLLTSWETIEKRLHAAAEADFVIVLYNQKSKKRNWQLNKAVQILLEYKVKETPVGIVTSAMRTNQTIRISTLENLPEEDIGMQTTVFIGNSNTRNYLDFMYTPRGYSDKYNL